MRAFFPDGRHLVVRSYESAMVYGFPSLEPVADLDLPAQDQGEGIAVTAEGDLLLSTEGQGTDVLRVRLPDEVRDAVGRSRRRGGRHADPHRRRERPAGHRLAGGARAARDDRGQRSPWPWFLGGFIGLGIIMVLMRSLRRR